MILWESVVYGKKNVIFPMALCFSILFPFIVVTLNPIDILCYAKSLVLSFPSIYALSLYYMVDPWFCTNKKLLMHNHWNDYFIIKAKNTTTNEYEQESWGKLNLHENKRLQIISIVEMKNSSCWKSVPRRMIGYRWKCKLSK